MNNSYKPNAQVYVVNNYSTNGTHRRQCKTIEQSGNIQGRDNLFTTPKVQFSPMSIKGWKEIFSPVEQICEL